MDQGAEIGVGDTMKKCNINAQLVRGKSTSTQRATIATLINGSSCWIHCTEDI